VVLFASAGLLGLADIPAVMVGAVAAGIYLAVALTRKPEPKPEAPAPR
jgi:hypothetical protein